MMMKKILLSFVPVLLFAATVFAQTTPAAKPPTVYPPGYMDTTYRPKITKDQLAKFAADPVKPGDFVFFGNSITAHGDWAKLFNDPRCKNRGISGDLSFGLLERMDEIIAGKPAKIFILIGINDISRNVPDSLIIRNHKRMIARIRNESPATQIYFCTILPVNASFGKSPNHYGKDEHILAINKAIKTYKAKKVKVIDLYPQFLDADNHLKAEYTADGLHPNDAGYQAWVKFFEKEGYLK